MKNTMRLNFTHTRPELLPLAVQRLSTALSRYEERLLPL